MARTRRERKKAKKNHGEEEEEKDRLSDLPDAILLHILSSLDDTRQCVRTSVLCKRWKSMWASLPDLAFWRTDFCDASSFNNFVLHVLSRRSDNLPLTKFAFAPYGKDESIVSKAINYAVSHNVQDLTVSFISASFKHLSPHLSNFRSLKSLELRFVMNLRLLQDLTLPCLTTLHLWECVFCVKGEATSFCVKGEEATSIDPFAKLVNLKSLKLDYCDMPGIANFKITGPQLDSLAIRMLDCRSCKVETYGPKLRFLSFNHHHFFNTFSSFDFPLLERADIDYSIWACSTYTRNFLLDMINVFRGLYHARSLLLSCCIIEGLMKCPGVLEDQASPFVRLKTLTVKFKPDGSSFNIPDNVMNYFGKDVTVQSIYKF